MNEEPTELARISTGDGKAIRRRTKGEQLQEAILRMHNQCVGAGFDLMKAMISCGVLLLLAKRQVGFGNFEDWLATHFEPSSRLCKRTAQRYMRKASDFLAFAEIPIKQITSLKIVRPALESPLAEEFYHATATVQGLPDPNAWESNRAIVDAAKSLLGVINVDPCATSHRDGFRFAEINYTEEDDGLDEGTPWPGTAFVAPGHNGDLSPWYTKAQSELEKGNLTAAVICLPVTILNTKAHSISIPFVLTNEPLEVTHRVKVEETGVYQPEVRQLSKRSVVLYLAASPDIGLFAHAFRDIGVVFVPQTSGGTVIEVEAVDRKPKRLNVPSN